MLKEFAEYLANQKIEPKDRVVRIGNEKFVINTNGDAKRIQSSLGLSKEVIGVWTLNAVIEYIKSHYDRDEKLMLHVVSPTRIQLLSALKSDGEREILIEAAASVPNFNFDYFIDVEELIISLQAKFVSTKDRDLLLQVLGNLKEENVKNTGDDGVSQSVVAKVGVATVANVKVPNPVQLAPYRTFSEVKQPVSPFIYRMKDGARGALFEADGSAWKLEAIKNIHDYLAENLAEEIKNDKLIILA